MCIFGAVFIALSFSRAAQLRRRIQAEDELRLIARTDALTGLDNRRTLDEILAKQWSTVKGNGSEFSLLFVDLDRFKVYNDTYGHQAGDDALASVARCIARSRHFDAPCDAPCDAACGATTLDWSVVVESCEADAAPCGQTNESSPH